MEGPSGGSGGRGGKGNKNDQVFPSPTNFISIIHTIIRVVCKLVYNNGDFFTGIFCLFVY